MWAIILSCYISDYTANDKSIYSTSCVEKKKKEKTKQNTDVCCYVPRNVLNKFVQLCEILYKSDPISCWSLLWKSGPTFRKFSTIKPVDSESLWITPIAEGACIFNYVLVCKSVFLSVFTFFKSRWFRFSESHYLSEKWDTSTW